nr:hypothetical protein CFP56_71465 [Quercus suber]
MNAVDDSGQSSEDADLYEQIYRTKKQQEHDCRLQSKSTHHGTLSNWRCASLPCTPCASLVHKAETPLLQLAAPHERTQPLPGTMINVVTKVGLVAHSLVWL